MFFHRSESKKPAPPSPVVEAERSALERGFDLPPPRPEFLPPPAGDDPQFARSYFDPEHWDSEYLDPPPADDRDRVKHEIGKLTGTAQASLIVSDFHLADGSAGGDDFLDSHILPDAELGLHTGGTPCGASRAAVFAGVVTYALERVAQRGPAGTRLDIVLNGDVINFLELKGRGSTLASPKHSLLFRTLAAARASADVFWLRGNHDYIVPQGPWHAGEYYINENLTVLAEHGDFWDDENWPPGPETKGSRLVLEAVALFEANASVVNTRNIKYLMAGVDNVRPLTRKAIVDFLDRRSKYSELAWVTALLARLKFKGVADDQAAYRGAMSRRKKPYEDWLIVQGHTHVPALLPGKYFNTGSWIPTLVVKDDRECHIEAFPFVLLYQDCDGSRVEEYYTVRGADPGCVPRVTLETEASIQQLREEYGYSKELS